MQQNDKPVFIYSTFPTIKAAEKAGGRLVDEGLAACVNILPGMTSIYVWQGKRHRDSEVVMIVKTTESLADRVIEQARRMHPYDNPALVVLPLAGGSAPFLDWIRQQTRERQTP
ncbi:MAG TPA: divalent-cation tolerance protein CutA [Hyphomicrobiaceae bacterium]|nr:divalent-cation tolerance protein CutA [Hyphomicrobiaceae bacterium]